MKQFREFALNTLVGGVLVMLPVYLAILLLLKAMKSLGELVRPLARLLPAWFPAERVASFLLVLIVCFLVGLALRTPTGQAVQVRFENSLLQKIPGYSLFRSMTRQLAGENREMAWKPALAEIEEALVPAFIIEELDDGSFTVFVPSAPTPVAGAIYILSAERVHPLNVPFTQTVMALTHWGAGSKELVAAMQERRAPLVGTK